MEELGSTPTRQEASSELPGSGHVVPEAWLGSFCCLESLYMQSTLTPVLATAFSRHLSSRVTGANCFATLQVVSS